MPAVALWRLGEHDRQHSVGVPYKFLYRQKAAGTLEVNGCVGAKHCYRFTLKVEFRKPILHCAIKITFISSFSL